MVTSPDQALAERLRVVLAGRPEVVFAYLFGSSASRRARRRSDVDVGIYASRPATPGGATTSDADTWGELAGALQAVVPERRVDVVLLDRAPPLLADRVIRGGRPIYSRDEVSRLRWVVKTKSRYSDLKPLREALDRTVAERVRSGHFGTRGG